MTGTKDSLKFEAVDEELPLVPNKNFAAASKAK